MSDEADIFIPYSAGRAPLPAHRIQTALEQLRNS
jgi:hypothetical protein